MNRSMMFDLVEGLLWCCVHIQRTDQFLIDRYDRDLAEVRCPRSGLNDVFNAGQC